MKKTINRFLSLLLAVIMVLGMLPMTVFAENSELPKPTFRIEFASKYEQWDPNKKSFKAGEPIHYAIVVDNTTTDFMVMVNKITFHCGQDSEQTWENESKIWTTPHGTQTHGRFKHVVTEQDVANGACIPKAEIEYTIYIDADDEEGVSGLNGTAEGYTQLGTSSGLKGVSVHKYVTSSPANGARYEEGEKVTFVTLITNNSNETLKDLVVHEDRHGEFHDITTADLAPNQTAKVYGFDYVNHSDYLRGCLYSYSTVTWDGAGDLNKEFDASVSSNTVSVPVGDANADYKPNTESFVSIKITAKTPPENGVAYQLGDKIELKFEIVNCSFQNPAKDLAAGTTGVNWSLGNDTQEVLQTQTLWSDTYASHTVDWHDILMGEVKVQAYVDAWDAETDEYCGSFSNVLVLPVSGSTSEWPDWKDQSIGLTQKLENAPANGKYFVAGETVRITVTSHEQINGLFETFKNYNYSTLHTGKGSERKYLGDLALDLHDEKDERSQTFLYTVTPEDVEKGWIRSEIDGWAEYIVVSDQYIVDGRPEYDTEYDKFYYTGDALMVPCGWPKPTQVALHADGPAKGSFYVVGDKVPLSVHVYFESAADGKIPPLKYAQEQLLQLTDDWENVDFSRNNELEKYTGIYQGTIYYTVTQEDADRGSAKLAYAFGVSNKEGEELYTVESNSVEVPCGAPIEENTGLGITQIETSVPANGVYYTVGETITYLITITNHGEEDLGKCTVTDSNLTGTLGSVEQLKAGESKSFNFSLVVTEELPILGVVFNTATVKTVYNEEQLERDSTVMSRAAELISMFGVEKRVTSTPANGTYYTAGETVTFELKLLESYLTENGEFFEAYVRDGYEFRFNDPLTGDVLSIDLTDTDTYTQTVDYTVTAADEEAGSVTNIAYLELRDGTNLNWNNSMSSNAVTVPTGEKTSVDPGEDEEPKSAEYAIEVTKIIEGENAPTDTRFSFQLEAGAKTYGLFITGADTGSFPSFNFTEAGTYTYTVSEVNSGKEGWTYDSSKIQVSIEIVEVETESGETALKVGTVTFTKDGTPVNSVSFTNTYTGSGSGTTPSSGDGGSGTTPSTGGSGSGTTPGTGGTDKPAGTGKDPWNDPFVDVSENEWFCEDVRFAYENELMNGTGGNMFSPYISTTRGMIVTILWRLEGKPSASGVCPFDDVKPGSYYEDAITWAAQNKIVDGYGYGKFGPDDPITREQLAAILYRYAEYKGYDVSVGEDTNILSYEDAFDISEYAYTPLQWACGEGLIGGYNGYLTPTASATRAQVAAILHRFFDKFVK